MDLFQTKPKLECKSPLLYLLAFPIKIPLRREKLGQESLVLSKGPATLKVTIWVTLNQST